MTVSTLKQLTYYSYRAMKDRCLRPSFPKYRYYGGRGITICDRWLKGEGELSGFGCFVADLGWRPSPRFTLDRLNSNGNYEPGNTRWATRKEQNRNTRKNIFVEYRGRRVTLAEAIEMAGSVVSPVAANRRIRLGWPVRSAVEGSEPDTIDPAYFRALYPNFDEIMGAMRLGNTPAAIDGVTRLIGIGKVLRAASNVRGGP